MRLLHISDIHFRAPDCLNADLDPDRPYRTRLIQDVRALVANREPVGAILVGGDIAFRGDPREYEVAHEWLGELAQACGCHLARVFVIPGNHDVDRRVITSSPAVRNAQAAISAAGNAHRERELRIQLQCAETAHALLAPIAAYNEFAKVFSCQIYGPEHLYWKQDLELQEGVRLRVYGLTSTVMSGIRGGDDTRENLQLYLSPLQTVLDPVDDVVNLVLCHHPPDWLIDNDEVDESFCNRASVHLLGHKHRQRVLRGDAFTRFSAGAVNPDRYVAGWQPGYNLIDVNVELELGRRVLAIDANVRYWQTNPERFVSRETEEGELQFHHRVPIRGPRVAIPTPSDFLPAGMELGVEAEHAAEGQLDVESSMSDEGTRDLVYRFWKLTMSQRREICLELGLISNAELSLPEPERYGRALLRAGERKMLAEVGNEVSRRERA